MVNQKLVELYAVMLILCTAVLFFSLFQMQANINAVMGRQEFSTLQFALQGIQIAAIGLVIGTFIIFIFLRRIHKKHKTLRKKHKRLHKLHNSLRKKHKALKEKIGSKKKPKKKK